MTRRELPTSDGKIMRALKLHESGLSRAVIAERLGVRPHNISGMLQVARKKREKMAAGAEQ